MHKCGGYDQPGHFYIIICLLLVTSWHKQTHPGYLLKSSITQLKGDLLKHVAMCKKMSNQFSICDFADNVGNKSKSIKNKKHNSTENILFAFQV